MTKDNSIEKKIIHEIEIIYGSDFQKKFGESALEVIVTALKNSLENSHKKNKVTLRLHKQEKDKDIIAGVDFSDSLEKLEEL